MTKKPKGKLFLTLLVGGLLLGLGAVAEAGWDEGVAAFKAGNYNQAAQEFQAFVDDRPDVYQGHYMLGQVLSKLDRNREALQHLQKAFELEPGNVGVQLALGKTYLDVGRYADAAGILGKIPVSQLPAQQQAAVHQMLFAAFEKSGDSARALDQLGKAAQAAPNDANLQYSYGAAALNSGNTAAAVSALQKSSQLAPRDQDKKRAYAQALVRRGRESTGNAKIQAYQQAASAAQSLVSQEASYDNLLLLGETQLGAKQYDSAISALQQAARKNAGDWHARYYLGQAYTQKEQYRSAESSLREALNLTASNKDKVTIWKQLGFVYEKQKQYDNSIAAYRQAGDSGAVARVQKNRETDEYNRQVEEEAEAIKRLQEEQEKIKKELEDLPGGPPPAL